MERRLLSESPQQLVRRLDRLYITLASVYIRVGRALGLHSKPRLRRTAKRYTLLKKRTPRSTGPAADQKRQGLGATPEASGGRC
jgi:hypothetical protein